jgi:hypothetical protein
MALVGAGTALDAGIQIDTQGTITAQEVAHLIDGLLLPVVYQLAGEVQGLLVLRLGHERPRMSHGPRHDGRNIQIGLEFGNLQFNLCHDSTSSA